MRAVKLEKPLFATWFYLNKDKAIGLDGFFGGSLAFVVSKKETIDHILVHCLKARVL